MVNSHTRSLNFIEKAYNLQFMIQSKDGYYQLPRGFTLWFTGLSGAGKSTITQALAGRLQRCSVSCEVLDGDILRSELSCELGFSAKDRETHLFRVAHIAYLLMKHRILVLASFISPYKALRYRLRHKIGHFVEVFVDAPLDVCENRDPKGLYKRARLGEISYFTGISDPYEPPDRPDLILKTDQQDVETCTEAVFDFLVKNEILIKK